MLRTEDTLAMPWPERTLSKIRDRSEDSSDQRLTELLPPEGFEETQEERVLRLWHRSYSVMEQPGLTIPPAKIILHDLRCRIPWDLTALPMHEQDLLERTLAGQGSAVMDHPMDLLAGESLMRRIWGDVTLNREDEFVFTLLDPVTEALLQTFQQDGYLPARQKIISFFLTVMSCLNLNGTLLLDDALAYFQETMASQMPPHPLFDEAALTRRLLHTAFAYILLPDGTEALIHPGVIDPMGLAKQARHIRLSEYCVPSGDDLVPDMLLSPAERSAMMALVAQLHRAVRPDVNVIDLMEDLRVLIHQNVPESALHEVLAASLMQRPSTAMLEAVRMLASYSPRWRSAGRGGVQ